MISGLARVLGAVALNAMLGQGAVAADIVPYRAHYALTLASTGATSGVVGAGGVLLDEWNETCNGWTEQQHLYLHLDYGQNDPEQDTVDTYSNLVTWEAKDASRFRFHLRRASTDAAYEEIRGEAELSGPEIGGLAAFKRPRKETLPLAPGTLFPAADTRLLIARAQAGEQFITRDVFDGTEVTRAGQITAFIGPQLAPGVGADDEKLPDSPLLDRPSWRIRLAFFPAGGGEVPDYEETVRLLDDGITQEMLIDYGDYRIRGTLEQIEALPRPHC